MPDIKIGLFHVLINLGYTIEVGCGENPLPISDFYSIYYDIKKMILSIFSKEIFELLV